MFLWRKITTPRWIESHGEAIDSIAPQKVAIIERAGSKKILIEVSCGSRPEAQRLCQCFGGETEQLRRNWLTTLMKAQKRQPLRIGKRLVVFDEPKRLERGSATGSLVMPSGAAFGTGDHPTTAMTLRLLEQATRKMNDGWSLADLGTGSGILALAGHRLGAGAVEAIDFDPAAISTAKANSALNGISSIKFSVQDVQEWRPLSKLDVITANLFSQLLIGVLPKIRRSLTAGGVFIFSGVMRSEETGVVRAIRRSGLRLDIARRRGKWVALAGRSD